MADARIVLALDTRSAHAELDRLWARLANAPAMTPGGGVGGLAGGVALGNLGSQAVNRVMGSSPVQGVLGGFQDALIGAAVGHENLGRVQGNIGSRQAVASRYGKLADLGMVDTEFLQQAYDIEQKYGAGSQARGEGKVMATLGADQANDTLGAMRDGLKHFFSEFAPMVAQEIGNVLRDTFFGGGKVR